MGPGGPSAEKRVCSKEKVKSVKSVRKGFSQKWLPRLGCLTVLAVNRAESPAFRGGHPPPANVRKEQYQVTLLIRPQGLFRGKRPIARYRRARVGKEQY